MYLVLRVLNTNAQIVTINSAIVYQNIQGVSEQDKLCMVGPACCPCIGNVYHFTELPIKVALDV
jgi:hypothetical protein